VVHTNLIAVGVPTVAETGLKSKSVDDEFLLPLGQELGGFWPVEKKLPDKGRHQNRQKTFEEENPLPAR
jgi:hypothetical protein